MNVSTRIALRYIFTRRSFHFISVITIISILGIIIGVAVLICVTSIFNGFREFTEEQLIGFDPHIRITAGEGAWLKGVDSMTSKILALPGITAASPVSQSRVIVFKGTNMKVMLLHSVRSNEIKSISGIANNVIAGKFSLGYRNSLPGVVIGAGFSGSIKALPGDSISILSFDMMESAIRQFEMTKGLPATVTGLFQSNNQEYDGLYGYISEEAGTKIMNRPEGASSSIDIRVDNIREVMELKSSLEKMFPGTTILTWYDLHKELYNIMKFERKSVFIILSLIIVIAVFNVLASLAMTVVEKKPDIALLKALGAADKMVKKIYLLEGLIIGLISTSIGTLLGVGLSLGQIKYGWLKLSPHKFLIKSLPVSLSTQDVVMIAGFSLLLSFIAALYPASKAAKVNITNTIREE